MTTPGGMTGQIPGAMSGWSALREAVALSTVTPAGPLVVGAGRLYAARLAPTTAGAAATCVLHDGVDATGPVVLALATATAGLPDDWPRVPVSIGFQNGLFPVFTAGGATVLVFWERA